MVFIDNIFKFLVPYFEKKERDRNFLLKFVPKGGVCAEIGVWRGEFSEKILNILKPKKIHLIDPWKFMPEYSNRWYGGTIAKNQKDMDAIYELVKQSFNINKQVIIHRNFSHKAVLTFKDNYFDFVYIDGDHSYEFVKKDLENFFPKVKGGGILAGDDYYSLWSLLNSFPIKKAVDNFREHYPVETLFLRRQFVLQKK